MKLHTQYFQLNKNKRQVKKIILSMSTNFVRPFLEYAEIFWDNCTQQSIEILESIHLEAAILITGRRPGTY